MNRLLLAAVCMLLPFTALAAAPEALIREADAAYTAGQYELALARYDSVLRSGWASASLHYNLGNCHYRLLHTGLAILHYEKALKLAPRHAAARQNLRLALRRVNEAQEPVPDLFIQAWLSRLYLQFTAGGWAWLSVALLWAALGGGALFLFGPAPGSRRLGFFGGILLLVLALACAGLARSRLSGERSSRYGIVLASSAFLKETPESPAPLLTLYEGYKVELHDRQGEWRKVLLRDAAHGTVWGFVLASELGEI